MTGLIKKSFSSNLLIMRILGLYLPDKYTSCFQVYGYIMYFLFIILLPVLTLRRLLEENVDISQVNYAGAYLAQASGFTTKILPFIRNGHRIKRCINYFEDPYFAIRTEEEKKIVDECVRICRRNNKGFLIYLAVCIVSWVVPPFFLEGHRFPLDIWSPLDSSKGLKSYYSLFVFLAAGLSYVGLSTMIDPLLGGLACHAAGQLKVLKYNLENLGQEAEFHKENQQLDVYVKIIQCVDHHDAILTFVKQYEECFSTVVFSQFAASVFALCFCCLQLSLMQTISVDALTSAAINVTVLLGQIYFYCYYGTTMFEENYSLTTAIYMGEWYEYDIRSQKALIILMERSKRPMIVTAGKILDLTLDTFMMIVRRSYSLLAVLKNYNKMSKGDMS